MRRTHRQAPPTVIAVNGASCTGSYQIDHDVIMVTLTGKPGHDTTKRF